MMIRFFAVSITALAIACANVVAQNTADVPPILKQVVGASKKLRYSGIRKVHMRFGPDIHQHTEYILKDGMRTRIWFPDEGAFRGQIIVENSNERRHYFPDRNQIDILPPRREEHFMRLGRSRDKDKIAYRVEGGEDIAGIDTKRVEMASSSGRVYLRMWIDPRTGLVLKRVVYGKNGTPQATAEFVKVDYKPQFKSSDFELNIRNAKVVTPRDRLADLVQRGGFQNVSLSPKGPMKLESARIQRIENVPALVQVYVSNNGRVTLFQVKAAIDPAKLKRLARGEQLGTYSWQTRGSSFVLVGNLPESKLRDLARYLGD